MAQTPQKTSDSLRRSERRPPILNCPAGLLSEDRDPTREIRNLLEQLQGAAKEARRNERIAEEECERLRSKLSDLEESAESTRAKDSQIKALARERDMLREQQSQYGPLISELKQKLKAKEAERLDALHELDSAKKGEGEPAQQFAALRQARDGMAAQINDLKNKVGELEDEVADLSYHRDAAEKAADATRKQMLDLQTALETAAAASESDATNIARLEAELQEMSEKCTSLNNQNASLAKSAEKASIEYAGLNQSLEAALKDRDAIAASLGEARTSLVAAQKQIDTIIRDRDANQEQLSETLITLDAQLKAQSIETGRLEKELSNAESKLADSEKLRKQFEQRRLDMIELGVQLENAQREIRSLSASLAEARLQAKLALRKAMAAGTRGAGRLDFGGAAVANPMQPPAIGNETDLSGEPAAKDEILSLRRTFQNFSRDQQQLELLAEMENRAQSLASGARDRGSPLLHRVSTTLGTLLRDLHDFPAQISEAPLRTVNQTVELIASLAANPNVETAGRLSEARVYVVDDDPSTCVTVVDALGLVGLQSDYALYSSTAVAELAGNRYDLIILDVHLPEMDGFELCSHIRNMALHAETPIFFITGNTSLENRVKSSLRGGNEFIAKPFIIQELALKALKSVLASQIQIR